MGKPKGSHGYITVTLSEEGIEAIAEAVARNLQEAFAANQTVAAPYHGAGAGINAEMERGEVSPATSYLPYLTEREAAEYLTKLGITTASRTLQKQRVTGGGCPFVKLGNRVRYRLQDLDEWLRQHRPVTSTSET